MLLAANGEVFGADFVTLPVLASTNCVYFSTVCLSACVLFNCKGIISCAGGTELASEVRHLWPKSIVKIVAVTADSLEDRWEQCLVCGVDGWLPKPFSTEDLSDTLQAVLQS